MRLLRGILTALLLIPLFSLHVQCSSGQEPETVIVPVGEPSFSGDDPYDSQGDLGCGSSTDTTSATLIDDGGETMVLVAFVGTHQAWMVYLTWSEFEALNARLGEVYGPDETAQLSHHDIDQLHDDLCGPAGGRSAQENQLYEIMQEVLSDRMDEIAADLCR